MRDLENRRDFLLQTVLPLAVGIAGAGSLIAIEIFTQQQHTAKKPQSSDGKTPSADSFFALDIDQQYSQRLTNLRSTAGNENVQVWPNVYDAASPTKINETDVVKNQTFLQGFVERNFPGQTIIFPKEGKPTFRFYNGKLMSPDSRFSAFLDGSGRFKKYAGLSQFINNVPAMAVEHYVRPSDPKNPQKHIVGLLRDAIPDGGFIMVFSRPSTPEKAESNYDIWELDTAIFSESVKVQAPKLTREMFYLTIGTQDRTDRQTKFYNKDNQANVVKVVVIADAQGRVTDKIPLENTPFSFSY
ncbi:MAG TPA: hypothetical protein VKC89_00750 [Patescibacteria group bacterium]|nr:hypothetical protein [Patescibacteria group bacterium]